MTTLYLIEKRGAYYRPDAAGYTYLKKEAGRYSHEEALARTHPNGPDGPRDGMSMWPEDDAPDFSSRCPRDVKVRALYEDRIEALEEHIANMLEMQECACGYDGPMDVCLGHATVLKRIEALEAKNGRLREALARVNLAVATSDDDPEALLAWVEIQTRAALKGEGE